jgi:hypothetical protein
MLLKAFLPRKAVTSLIIAQSGRTGFEFSIMEGPKSLRLCGRSVVGLSSNPVSTIVAWNGRRWFDYCLMPQRSACICCDAKPKIIDCLLMLIIRT